MTFPLYFLSLKHYSSTYKSFSRGLFLQRSYIEAAVIVTPVAFSIHCYENWILNAVLYTYRVHLLGLGVSDFCDFLRS